MPSDRRGPVHSAALRGALWITLIALLATGAALTVQYLQTTRLLQERAQALVDDETASLIARYDDDGLGGVEAAINRQAGLPRLNEFFYLLAAPDGTPIAGNLLAWPVEVAAAGFHSFATEVVNTRGTPTRRWVDARAVTLGGNYRLLVGSFADERASLRARYFSALFWSLLVTGVLGLALGWWYSRRGLRFVDDVSDVGQRILAGRLSERVPVSDRGDEYDRLAATINSCFAEIERLIGSLRATTDGMAHDLKTPLTRIRARLELAELAGTDVPPDATAQSRRDLDILLELIDGALGLARAEATATTGFTTLALDAVALDAVDLYRPLAEDAGVTLAADLAPVQVKGARSLLAQMVANLLDNAIKFTPAGGIVSIQTVDDVGGARLIVSDTGPGIPVADRVIVLDRFRRLARDEAQPGSGVGLSVVAVAARVHGATLTLGDAAPGLRVEIVFPNAI
jgi:signal transduction histidine kinase